MNCKPLQLSFSLEPKRSQLEHSKPEPNCKPLQLSVSLEPKRSQLEHSKPEPKPERELWQQPKPALPPW